MISTGAIILVKTWSVGMKHKINEHLCTLHAVIVHMHIQYKCKCIHFHMYIQNMRMCILVYMDINPQ